MVHSTLWNSGQTEQGVIAWRSVVTSETLPDVLGGALVAYSLVAGMTFAGSRGADGTLFTADDTQLILPQGYIIVYLEDPAFHVSQTQPAELSLQPVAGFLPIDLRDLPCAEALDHLSERLRTCYAYTDLYGVDWPALVEEFRNWDVEDDPIAFYRLLTDMASRAPGRRVFAAPELPLLKLMNPELDLTVVDSDSPLVMSTEFADGYAIARFRSFTGGRQTISQWEDFISEARARLVKGMVVDLSGARGGDGALAMILAAYFISSQAAFSFDNSRLSRYDSSLTGFSPIFVSSAGFYAPDSSHLFSGPVAILVSPQCSSAYELFTYLHRDRAVIARSGTTAGAGGEINVVLMPGKISFFYTFLREKDRNGQPAWERRGITPEIMVDPKTLNDAGLGALFNS